MKSLVNKKMAFLVLSVICAYYSFAQDDKKLELDINVNKGDSNWYQQPWVWVVGGAVLLLLLVAILRGGGSKKE